MQGPPPERSADLYGVETRGRPGRKTEYFYAGWMAVACLVAVIANIAVSGVQCGGRAETTQ